MASMLTSFFGVTGPCFRGANWITPGASVVLMGVEVPFDSATPERVFVSGEARPGRGYLEPKGETGKENFVVRGGPCAGR